MQSIRQTVSTNHPSCPVDVDRLGALYTLIMHTVKGKGSSYSITERRVPELIPVLGSQPAGDVSHKPGGRLPAITFRQACSYPRNPYESCYQFRCLVNRGTIGVNSLPKTVTRQRRGCDLNPGPSAPEFSTLTTRLPSHPTNRYYQKNYI